MAATCLLLAASVAGGCGGDDEPAALMPGVEGLRLDVALSDLASQGVDEDDVEVVGGGTLGVLDESNWDVCEQRPAAGTAISDVRLIVDRACGEDDSGSPPSGSDDEPGDVADDPDPSDGSSATAEDEQADAAAAEPAEPDPMSPVQFAVSARGDIADLRKDLSDSITALADGSFLRLTTNYLEMSFNLGQLQALDPPEEARDAWNNALGDLEAAMDAYSDALDGDSLDGVSQALAQVDASLGALTGIVESVA